MPSAKPAATGKASGKKVATTGGRRYRLTNFKAPVLEKGKWYPTEDVAKPAKRAHKPTLAKLRASVKPGAVVILLAGRFKGKRAVVLSQLKSGLLLVTGASRVTAAARWGAVHAVAGKRWLTRSAPFIPHAGPYAVNGVPLRRVNASYVIATSTKIDVSKVDVSSIDEKIFSAKEERATKQIGKDEASFFAVQRTGSKSAVTSDARKALQTKVDSALALNEVTKAYLKSKFTLSKNDAVHKMKF